MIENLSEYQHFIWDWNGTLFNDVELCNSIINNILIDNELPPLSIEKYRDIFTFPVKDYYTKAGLTFESKSFEELGAQFMDEYEKSKLHCGFYPSALNILNYLSDAGKDQYILSAYKLDTLNQILSEINIKEYFKKIYGLNDIYAGSKESLAKELIKEIDLERDKAVLIGDTLHDYEVANSVGVDVILISAGHQSRTQWKHLNNSVTFLNNLDDLLKLL